MDFAAAALLAFVAAALLAFGADCLVFAGKHEERINIILSDRAK